MSNLNLQYTVGRNSSSAVWNDITTNGINTREKSEDDKQLNKSIYKSYLDALRTKSDENTQKLLKTLENSPADTVSKLFGKLQSSTAANIGKLFEGLNINSADEMSKLLEGISTEETDKDEDKLRKTDDESKTDSSLQKNIKKTTEKLSAENNALNINSEQLSAAAERLHKAFEENEETGEIDIEEAYNAAEDFVNSYNSFSDAIKGAKSGAVSGKAQFISEMLDSYGNKIGKAGIVSDEDGRLSVDREKLAASSPKDREEVFKKKDSFTEFIDGQAKQLAAYAQTDIYQRSSAYTDAGNITQISNISGSFFNMLG